jgi:hypothetical protein
MQLWSACTIQVVSRGSDSATALTQNPDQFFGVRPAQTARRRPEGRRLDDSASDGTIESYSAFSAPSVSLR